MKDRKEYFKEYYKRNRKKLIERAREWNENNPDRYKQNKFNYRENHRQEINEKRMEKYYKEKEQKNNEKK